MVAESLQRDGELGLRFTKQWLESTTWIELPFDVYSNAPICTKRRLDGQVKRYDAFGAIHTSPPTPVLLENKAYNSAGGKQGQEFWEFLANAYSVTAQEIKDGADARYEFMWVTTHPFDQTSWNELTTAKRVKEALEKHPEALGNDGSHDIDPDLLSTVADRIWLLVLRDKQESLMLHASELAQVEGLLNRKGK